MLSPLSKGSYVRRHRSLGAKGAGRSSSGLALICLLVLSLLLATSADAATVTQRPLLFTIDGATVPDGPLNRGAWAAVDNATGALYVNESDTALGSGHSFTRIYRFHPDGSPWPFSATGLGYLEGTPSAPMAQAGIAVDNSGGPNQSHLYVAYAGTLEAFDFGGNRLWNRPVSGLGVARDVAVDSSGNSYVTKETGTWKYANTGSPPAEIGFIDKNGEAIDAREPDEVFIRESLGAGHQIEKWVGGAFSSVFDPFATDVYVDQSNPGGSIFTAYEGTDERQLIQVTATAGEFRLSFGGAQTSDLRFDSTFEQVKEALEALPTIGAGNTRVSGWGFQEWMVEFTSMVGEEDVELLGCEDGTAPLSGGGCSVSQTEQGEPSDLQEYAPAGTLLGTYGLGTLASSQSVAYNPSLDRVYVVQLSRWTVGSPSIAVFGPPQTGTVPDLTIDAPSEIGIGSAHFSGTVNPQGTNSEWKFQWKTGREPWTSAPSSPPQSLPADSSDHTVDYSTNALRGGRMYKVRLVAVNTANQLESASDPKIFTTAKAAQAPEVTIAAPNAITASGATISGTVNPQEDSADWRVQTSTDPACATGFTDRPVQEVLASTTAVDVEYDITGLLPSERYCVRIVATNSAGSTASETKEFETEEVLPTQVFTAYAAPRTDVSARLNGYVNPQGSKATYRFEYSEDGSNWTALPDELTSEDRQQITVASNLTGLEPNTTYHYRFVVESGAGPVSAAEKTFTTRTISEMTPPQRGIELVNQPNKGNQALGVELFSGEPSLVRSDGSKVVWRLFGGAPGGNTGTSVGFLSTRTPQGWVSQPIAPPADQQVGGGSYAYKLSLISPDFHEFLVRALQTGAQQNEPPTFVHIDDEYNQEVLSTFTEARFGQLYENADMTPDGEHVVLFKPETEQLVEIGPQEDVVSIMPDGETAECGVPADGFYGPIGGGSSPTGTQWQSTYHRMATTDASRVYFEAFPNGGGCSESAFHHHALYYRDRSSGQTVEIDAGADKSPPALIRATPDGHVVYFLTAAAHSPDDENSSGDVYSWDADSGSYTCLTCVVPEASLSTVQPVRISEDFSHLYFGTTAQLIPGYGNPNSESIYSLDLGSGTLRFVAREDGRSLGTARLSDDGAVLLFKSTFGYGKLTADERAPECTSFLIDTEKSAACAEIFRYEESGESLECLSCLPGGVTRYDVGEMGAAAALSADGNTVAFVSKERISPADINSAPDVYEWRNGAVRLISDGETDYVGSSFTSTPRIYGIDGSGDNIFFTIVQPGLTGYEQDKTANLYDARVGGGFPRPQDPVHCSEESCQGPLQAPPEQAAIGSSGLAGSGNPEAARKGRCAAKKGKARRRCRHGRKLRKHAKGGITGKPTNGRDNAGSGK